MVSAVARGDPRGGVLRTRLAVVADLSPLRGRLRSWLHDRGVEEREAENVALIATEAVANSLQHGYRDGTGPVDVRLWFRSDRRLQLEVHDGGEWDGFLARPDGRGLAMMRALSDEMTITRRVDGTSVVSIRTVEHAPVSV